jgi:hypothetical protein
MDKELQDLINSAYDTEHGKGWIPSGSHQALVDRLVALGLVDVSTPTWPRLTRQGMAFRTL